MATEAYVGVTWHFLGEDWEMKSLSLTTMPLEERHTAANIADWLEEATAKFPIAFEKVKVVVHDNGANVVAAATILRETLKELQSFLVENSMSPSLPFHSWSKTLKSPH